MPNTTPKRAKTSIEAHFLMAERALRGLNKSIDEQLDRVRDLEVEHAMALYKSGKAGVRDSKDSINELRRRIG